MKDFFLINSNIFVRIDSGEITSLKVFNEEILHNKSDCGWNHTEIEMFPIIGPSKKNFKVLNSILDQHGILRELDYYLKLEENNKLIFEKKYLKNTKIKNSKFGSKDSPEFIFWEFDFIFRKTIELFENYLKISFEIICDENMPFMLGFHPAFKLSGDLDEIVKFNDFEIGIDEILKVGNTAKPVLNCSDINLIKKSGLNVNLKTIGFDNFMLWSPNKNMICIEPITFYPYTKNKKLEDGFINLEEKNKFEVEISWN